MVADSGTFLCIYPFEFQAIQSHLSIFSAVSGLSRFSPSASSRVWDGDYLPAKSLSGARSSVSPWPDGDGPNRQWHSGTQPASSSRTTIVSSMAVDMRIIRFLII